MPKIMTKWFNKLLDYAPYILLYPPIMPNLYLKPPIEGLPFLYLY